MPPFPCCCPSHPRVLLGSVSSFGGRFWCPEAWSGGKAGQLVPSWGCWSPLLERRRVGRGTACQNSELHYIPSWGCRVVGGRGVPQPQHPESLRDQVPRVSPEKELRARAPEWGKSWGENHRGAAVRVVIMQAESREVSGHVLLRQELLAQGLPRVQASRRPRGDPRVTLGPTWGASLQRLLKDHWGSGSCGQRGGIRATGGASEGVAQREGRGFRRAQQRDSRRRERRAASGWKAGPFAGWGRGSGVAGLRWAPLGVGDLRGGHFVSWDSGDTRRPPSRRADRRY